jgi:hypothetical protein
MKRHANPDVPLPILLVGAAAFGGALVWWITRPKTNDVPATSRQPIAVSEPMAIMGGGLRMDGACPPGQEWGWSGQGRGGNARCVPITVEPISDVQVRQSDVLLSPEEEARRVAEVNLTPAQREVFSSSLEALNKRTSQLQATRPDRVREAALRGITERQVIEAARREYDSAYDELLRQAAQLK